MRSTMATVALAMVSAIGFSQGSAAADPLKSICGLVDAFVERGGAAGVEYLTTTLAADWPKDKQRQLSEAVTREIGERDYLGGTVYSVAEIGDELKSYLVTIQIEQYGLFFMRLLYTRIGAEFELTNFDLNGKYTDLTVRAYEHEPVREDCDQ